RSNYEGYVRVNTLFAEQLARLIEPDDTVWIHDYHLIPLASQLRERGIGNRIGFFLHTPLAAAELLVTLPHHRELFCTLAACDLVGVLTRRDMRALCEYFQATTGASTAPDGTIALPDGSHFRGGHFPISIDTAGTVETARATVSGVACQRLRRSLDDPALVIGVDRLDYSKGLLE